MTPASPLPEGRADGRGGFDAYDEPAHPPYYRMHCPECFDRTPTEAGEPDVAEAAMWASEARGRADLLDCLQEMDPDEPGIDAEARAERRGYNVALVDLASISMQLNEGHRSAPVVAVLEAGEAWRLDFICCGRDDGSQVFADEATARSVREHYLRKLFDGDHERQAVLTRTSEAPRPWVGGPTAAAPVVPPSCDCNPGPEQPCYCFYATAPVVGEREEKP